jgi:predicted aconitase
MQLTRDEQDMLEGGQGLARQKAMELLVNYGEAVGADKFVDTNNVSVIVGAIPDADIIKKVVPSLDVDEIASKFFLDSDEIVIVDKVKAFTTSNAYFRDLAYPELQSGGKETCDLIEKIQRYSQRIGIATLNTCVPYQCGNIPTKGEHCAWTESSAIAYCNSVIGARTNIEGQQSSFASAVTGKTPLAGMQLNENREGSVVVKLDVDMNTIQDWALLGYFAGPQVGFDVPVYTNVKKVPDLYMLMSLCAAGIASGSIVMFHIEGVTPEAATLEMATGNRKDLRIVSYGSEERKHAYEKLNHSKKDDVDIVVLGCPHYSLERMATVAQILDGKKVHENVSLYITTGRTQKALAKRLGYADQIEKAGALILEDSCGNVLDLDPSRVLASDSAKLVHYIPGMTGVINTWLGTMEECIEAAITGKWRGVLK